MTQSFVCGVIGNPNCGKTTLFNALTGTKQSVGNWPGVTVERKTGEFEIKQAGRPSEKVQLVDLPGTYSLDLQDLDVSMDEQIARQFVVNNEADLIINILDASNLERHLYLTVQLLEMNVPMICVLNMMDVAKKEGVEIDLEQLEKKLGVAILPISASTGSGIKGLKETLLQQKQQPTQNNNNNDTGQQKNLVHYPQTFLDCVAPISEFLASEKKQNPQDQNTIDQSDWLATQYISLNSQDIAPAKLAELVKKQQTLFAQNSDESIDVLMANHRYRAINHLLSDLIRQPEISHSLSDKIDKLVLNRFLGIPIFFAMMYLMFLFSINIGGAFIDFFDGLFATVFVDGTRFLLEQVSTPQWLITLLADGLGGGIQLVATFIPIIASLYLFLAFIEDSGYMARAAFVMDRVMRAVGLPGKSFVPLIVGFGCNVPAVMAARTMDTERDRLLTIAMAPFMSCGARLSVFALFAAAFFDEGGALVVFALYLLGIFMALVTGFALKSTLFTAELTPFVMELPAYHVPTLKGILIKTWDKLKGFCLRAGKTIIIVVIALSFLSSIGKDGSFGNENKSNSMLAVIGQTITPIFSPLGIQEDNWPATVGIFTGIFAKEAVVGTLNALYVNLDGEAVSDDAEYDLFAGVSDALATVPANLADVADNLLDPLGMSIVKSDKQAAAAEQDVDLSTFDTMAKLFVDKAAAFSYLVFVLLYTPCVATLGAMVRESGVKWMLFVALWTTGLAYTSGVITYQVSHFSQAPSSAAGWIVACLLFIVATLWSLRRQGQKIQNKYIPLKAI